MGRGLGRSSGAFLGRPFPDRTAGSALTGARPLLRGLVAAPPWPHRRELHTFGPDPGFRREDRGPESRIGILCRRAEQALPSPRLLRPDLLRNAIRDARGH